MRRSEAAMLTVLVLAIALTVLVVLAMSMSRQAHHDHLNSVITSFEGGSR